MVYAGVLPGDIFIGATMVEMGGERWGMVDKNFMVNHARDEAHVLSILIHEGFHARQIRLHGGTGFQQIRGAEGERPQIYYILEVAALLEAWNSEGAARLSAINDALYFRAARRELVSSAVPGLENSFEIGEGLVIYTEMKLAMSEAERKNYIASWFEAEFINKDSEQLTVSWHWGYRSGALYALLLDYATEGSWRLGRIAYQTTDLARLLREVLAITQPTTPDDFERYRYDEVVGVVRWRIEENQRRTEAAIAVTLWWKTTFLSLKALLFVSGGGWM